MSTPFDLDARSTTVDPSAFARDFAHAQDRLRRDPHRAGLLPPAAWARFLAPDLARDAEHWVAREDGRLVGRVGASLAPGRRDIGYVGFFEIDGTHPRADLVARALIDAAERWLAARDVRLAYAPVNLTTWLSYRFRLPPGDPDAFAWEPSQPDEYVAFFTRAGFGEAMRYHTDVFPAPAFASAMEPSHARALATGHRFRPFDLATPRDLELLHRVSMVGFADAFLFSPLSFTHFRELYVPALARFDAAPSSFLVDPSGREVGFLFAFLDGPHLVYKSIAILPEARGKGLSDGLFFEAWRAAKAKGAAPSTVVTALVKAGAQSESYTRKAPRLARHEYVLLAKERR